MKKLLYGIFLIPVVMMNPAFAQSVDDMATDQERRGMCADLREDAQIELSAITETVKENWENFRDENGSITQFFSELSDDEKTSLQTLRRSTKDMIQGEKKNAKESFRNSYDLGIFDELQGIVIDLRTTSFEELRELVDDDKLISYDVRVEEYITTLESNTDLRKDSAETKFSYRKICYDTKTQAMYDNISEKLTQLLATWSDEKKLQILPAFIERLETMIDKTEQGSKPEDWKTSRVDVLHTLIDSINDILDSIGV